MSCRGAAAAAAAVAACMSRRHSRERVGSEGERTERASPDAFLAPSKTEEVDKRDRRGSKRHETWHLTTTTTSTTTTTTTITTTGKNTDVVEVVADFEKWLKMRNAEPAVPSSMDLVDTTKVVEGVDRYLGEEMLSHNCFLGKDPYGLSIDIDLADTKKYNLSSGYDPILQDLTQSENRLLTEEPSCEKVVDEYMLSEFQLDHLDPLATLASDDMMVAGEILPSTSNQPATLKVGSQGVEQGAAGSAAVLEENTEIPCEKSTQVLFDDLPVDFRGMDEMDGRKTESQVEAQSSENPSDLFIETLTPLEENSSNSTATSTSTDPQSGMLERLKKTRMKLEPRIIKKRMSMTQRLLEKRPFKHINGKSFAETASQDSMMAVVAISTDKVSNTTQIVINTGTEKQIYQGKTSELIEATGNFPKLPKIDTSTVIWNDTVGYGIDNQNNQLEIVISNALKELGITDDSLQPTSVTETDKVWLCPRDGCNRQFGRLYTLKGHLLAHYGVRPFKCDFEGCTWAFYSEFKLKRHKETHLKRKDYVCEVEGCNRRFTTIYNLWSHEKLHSRPNRIVCQVPDCDEKFQTKRALELHMKSHDQRHAPYVCQHEGCGKRYYSSNALTSHQRSHSYKEVDIKCSWPGCGKVFDKPCRLKAHTRSHTGCKPYHCTFQDCKWAFTSSSKLKRHQKKHTNERKFVCDAPGCGKAFMRSEHLKEHRLTHTEGRYFQCYVCNARFSAKSSLYVHIKKHQQVKTNNLPGGMPDYKLGGPKRAKTKESHCSRVKPIVKSSKRRINAEVTNVEIAERTDEKNSSDLHEINLNMYSQNHDYLKWLYRCPITACGHFAGNETNLREHLLKTHEVRYEDSLNKSSSDTDIDYILYAVDDVKLSTPPATLSVDEEQMIMVTPCDTVVHGTSSSSTERCLPEPEPPPFNTLLKNTEQLGIDTRVVKQPDKEVVATKKGQGSARTDLTYSDWSKLKKTGALTESTGALTGTSDVVLNASNDLNESLLLTEELDVPSMYYQDDAGYGTAGTEYQVLLLDSNPLESTGNLRLVPNDFRDGRECSDFDDRSLE